MKTFNYKELRKFMIEKEISINDISRVLGVSKTAVYNKFNLKNKNGFNSGDIRKICEEYKISANIFFDNQVNQ